LYIGTINGEQVILAICVIFKIKWHIDINIGTRLLYIALFVGNIRYIY